MWPWCKPSKVPNTIILFCIFWSDIPVLYQNSKGFLSTSIDEPEMISCYDKFSDINLLCVSHKDYNYTL